MKEKQALAFNLKRLRQFKGLTQEDLAKKIGLTKDTICKLETGKQENIGMKFLTAICRELDISIEELFMEDPKKIRLDLIVSDKNVDTVKAAVEAFKKFFE